MTHLSQPDKMHSSKRNPAPAKQRGILKPFSVPSRMTASGQKTRLTDARVRAALWRHAGNLAEAARDCGITRQSMWERVQKPELQAFMVEIRNAVGDFVENEIMKAIAAGDMTTARWYADRRLRNRGFGQFVAHVDETPPDPEAQAAAQRLIDFYAAEMDRRYRASLGPPLIELKTGQN